MLQVQLDQPDQPGLKEIRVALVLKGATGPQGIQGPAGADGGAGCISKYVDGGLTEGCLESIGIDGRAGTIQFMFDDGSQYTAMLLK